MQTYIPHHFYNLLMRQLPSIAADSKVLDVGCGEGWMTRELANRYPEASILGVDKHFKAIQRCRYLASVENLSIEYQITNIEQYKFSSDEKFDLLTCHNVLAHCEQSLLVLRKLIDQLKPGGQLSLVVENPGAKAIEQSFRKERIDWSSFADYPERLLEWFLPFELLVDQKVKKKVDGRILHPLHELELWLNEWQDVSFEVRGLSVFMDYCEDNIEVNPQQVWLEEALGKDQEFIRYAYFYHIIVKR